MKWFSLPRISMILLSAFVALPTHALRVATYNVRNFDYDTPSGTPTNKSELAEILISLNADLIGVQEIVKPDVFAEFLKTNLPDFQFVLSKCGGAHEQHLGFIYNKYKIQLLNIQEDERTMGTVKKVGDVCPTEGSRPMMVAKFRSMEGKLNLFTAISVHLKSGADGSSIGKRQLQYQEIVTALNEIRAKGEKSIMVMGDFNTTEYSASAQGKQNFIQTFAGAQMVDLGKDTVACSNYYFNKETGGPSGELSASVLDHILATSEMTKQNKVAPAQAQTQCLVHQCMPAKAQDLGVTYEGVSDHCPLTTEVL